jgi:NADH-quinone oxidoreductase subunit H
MDPLVLLIQLALMAVVFAAILIIMAYLTYFERKVVARIQVRLGPMRAGPYGVLQPIADGLKLLAKEDVIPSGADRPIFLLAPLISFVMAVAAWAVIPFGDSVTVFGRQVPLQLADINVGVLYILAMGSVAVYGIVLGGWASNNKYALLGALRSSAQVISYEISLGFGLMGVLLLSGTLSLSGIVEAQRNMGVWFLFLQPVGFVVYLVSAIAETNRLPFDLPEAESELVAGFHVEYSGFRFALYFLAEYIHMLVVSALASTLFLGGWLPPFGLPLPPILWFLAKVSFFVFLYYWLRATLPRFRYDQLMSLCWKVLFPVGLANVMVTAAAKLVITGIR